MINPENTEKLFELIVSDNTRFDKERKKILENFRESEKHLRKYVEALTDLEKQQARVNFSEFKALQGRMLNDLLNFNPKDIPSNTELVKAYTNSLVHNENDFTEISSALFDFEQRWEKFLVRYPTFVNTNFDTYFKNKHLMLYASVNDAQGLQNMGVISSQLEQSRQELEKVIMHIEKIQDYINMYIYIGAENERQLGLLKSLMESSDSYEVSDFFDIASETIQKIDLIKAKSKKARVPVPVVRVFNAKNRGVYKYTLRFGDFTVLYENFFIDAVKNKIENKAFTWEEHSRNSQFLEEISDEKLMRQEETGLFVYLDNFPIDGIFSGREVVEDLCVSPEYAVTVEELSSKSLVSFVILASILFFSSVITTMIGGGAVIFNVILCIGSLIGFKMFLKFLKKSQEDFRNMPSFFTFSKIDMLLFKEGDNFIIDDALEGAIYEFDNTIMNKKYHEALKANMEFVKINSK